MVPEISFSCSPSRTLKRRDTSFLEENGTKQVDTAKAELFFLGYPGMDKNKHSEIVEKSG